MDLLCMVAAQLVEEREHLDKQQNKINNTATSNSVNSVVATATPVPNEMNAVERRISCHRCGNIRKRQMNCSKGKKQSSI